MFCSEFSDGSGKGGAESVILVVVMCLLFGGWGVVHGLGTHGLI